MKITVCSRSFSKNSILRQELTERCDALSGVELQYNSEGHSLQGPALAKFLHDADRAIVGLETIDRDLLMACPALRIIGKYGVGLNNIDLQACLDANLKIGWTPGVNRWSVAEMCIALMISSQRRLFESNRQILNGQWAQLSGPQLSSSTVGIVGFGHVGQALAQLLSSFGCSVIVSDLIDFGKTDKLGSASQVPFDELIEQSDIVTLHVPSTPLTRGMIDAKVLERMKRQAVLINTARGDIVNLHALKHALVTGQIAGAAIDVFAPEPPQDSVLIALPNLISTAHLGGSSQEAILAMGRAAIKGLFEARPADSFFQYA